MTGWGSRQGPLATDYGRLTETELRMADSESETAEGLARSFNALIDEKAWETDVPETQTVAVAQTSTAASTNPPSLPHLLEALLFVGGVPLTAERAAAAIRGLTSSQFAQAIASLNRDYRRQAGNRQHSRRGVRSVGPPTGAPESDRGGAARRIRTERGLVRNDATVS